MNLGPIPYIPVSRAAVPASDSLEEVAGTRAVDFGRQEEQQDSTYTPGNGASDEERQEETGEREDVPELVAALPEDDLDAERISTIHLLA